jgi:hypothetical protein
VVLAHQTPLENSRFVSVTRRVLFVVTGVGVPESIDLDGGQIK